VEATEQAIKAALSSGYPVVVGINVYSSFEGGDVAQTGNVPLPQPGEQQLGAHAVVCVGYTYDRWIMRNSWGAQWGDQGYFYLPIQYLTDPNLCTTDFWVITSVSKDPAPGFKAPISRHHRHGFPHLFQFLQPQPSFQQQSYQEQPYQQQPYQEQFYQEQPYQQQSYQEQPYHHHHHHPHHHHHHHPFSQLFQF